MVTCAVNVFFPVFSVFHKFSISDICSSVIFSIFLLSSNHFVVQLFSR